LKTRILFVDDEPYVLQGLCRMLRGLRDEWKMVFAGSGQEALDQMAEKPFDVLVTDVRMPGMDGMALLNRVRRQYPKTVRIALSGQSDQETLIKAVGPTHQFLSKPCDAETVQSTIRRACALREHLADENLQKTISGLTSLPSPSAFCSKMLSELQDPDTSVSRLGELISRDVAMTTKVLQVVNSSYFGLRQRVSTPAAAAVLLGVDTMRSLVLSVGVFSQKPRTGTSRPLVERLANHSYRVSALARRIAEAERADKQLKEQIFVAALVHDVGKLVLLDSFPDEYAVLWEWADRQEKPLWMLEKEAFGAAHADVGAYLLGLWGFTDIIVEAVAFHHCPSQCPGQAFDPLSVVHAADALEAEQSSPDAGSADLDVEYLTGIGLADRIDTWRELIPDSLSEEQPNVCENPVR